jgi:membrane protein implicated in regulation of membrane protease activity
MIFGVPVWAIWIIVGIVFIIIEIFTPAFFSFIIGLACFVAGLSAVFTPSGWFPGNFIVQLAVFGASLTVMMLFLRPVFLKYFVKAGRKSNVDALIGTEVLVDSDIDNVKGTGYVKSGADYFKARSSDGNPIEKGTVVVIEKFEGITATVSIKKT